ncbi:MAG: PspC domain-containing protein [Candidatus Caldarchaeum sp.]|nr:PspC domain-containing protein [Candidatus Caldarchaeum sp.]
MSSKVLERSERNRVLAGVFGGLGEYLNVDANLLRIVGVVLLIVAPAIMAVLYVFAALLIPRRGGAPYLSPSADMSKIGPALVGVVLLIIGFGLMGGSPLLVFGIPPFTMALTGLAGLLIAVIGAVLLIDQLRKI